MKHFICGMWLWCAGLAAGAGTNQPSLLWKFPLVEAVGGLGADAAPAVADDGTVYVATFFGQLCAVSATGRGLWRFQAGREIHSAPAIGDDGSIYFGCRDWKFYALTPTGRRKWTFSTGGWVDSSPALGTDGTIYFGSWDGNFYAVNPDGSEKWRFAAGGIVDSSPAIAADGTVYFGSHDNHFYALKPDGTLRWKYAADNVIPSSPAIGADGTVYFTSMDHCLYALAPDGRLVWRRDIRNITASSPVLDAAGNIYLSPGIFNYSLGPDGRRRYICGAPSEVGTAALAVTNGEVFFAHPWRFFNAYVNEGHDGQARLAWSFEMPDGTLLASPVMSRTGVIYAMNGHFLYAFGTDWGAAPGAAGTWPMFHANARHTGRVGTR